MLVCPWFVASSFVGLLLVICMICRFVVGSLLFWFGFIVALWLGCCWFVVGVLFVCCRCVGALLLVWCWFVVGVLLVCWLFVCGVLLICCCFVFDLLMCCCCSLAALYVVFVDLLSVCGWSDDVRFCLFSVC